MLAILLVLGLVVNDSTVAAARPAEQAPNKEPEDEGAKGDGRPERRQDDDPAARNPPQGRPPEREKAGPTPIPVSVGLAPPHVPGPAPTAPAAPQPSPDPVPAPEPAVPTAAPVPTPTPTQTSVWPHATPPPQVAPPRDDGRERCAREAGCVGATSPPPPPPTATLGPNSASAPSAWAPVAIHGTPTVGAAVAVLGLGALVGLALGRLFVALGCRIDRERLLAHPARRAMLVHVAVHPGASAADMARAANVDLGRALYHLALLVREDAVRTRRFAGARRFFPVDAPRVDEGMVAAEALGSPARGSGRVLALLAARTGASLSQVARTLGISAGNAHYHLGRLSRAGLVERVNHGRRARHYLTTTGQDVAARWRNLAAAASAGAPASTHAGSASAA